MFHLVLESYDGWAPGADSEEKHEPASDIDTVVVDSLKVLDPEWPIREADIAWRGWHGKSLTMRFCQKVSFSPPMSALKPCGRSIVERPLARVTPGSHS